ncbi:MAG: cellulose biosynthesis protein BcsN [Pseudomonadota bacterium]
MTYRRKWLAPTALVLTAALTGCNGSNGLDDAFTTGSVGRLNLEAPAPFVSNYSIARTVSTSDALVEPAVRYASIMEVSETRYLNGVSQRIILQGQPDQYGENWIRAAISDGRKQKGQTDTLIVKAPSARSVSQRLKEHFPNTRMVINAASFSNSYGVFGTAHDRGMGQTAKRHKCHYGWQFLRPQHQKNSISLPKLGSKPEAMMMEVRLCQKGMSVDQFVAFMNGLRLDVPSDVLSARSSTNWSSGAPLSRRGAADLVGAGFEPNLESASLALAPMVQPQVQKAVPKRIKRRTLQPVAQPSKLKRPVLKPTKPTLVVPKPTLTASTRPMPAASKVPTEVELIVRQSNRIAVSEVAKFPTVPLPQ